MAVNTKTASRRALHFDSLAEALADAEQLAAGPHETTGNWSLAQILEHLAKSIAANIDGVKAKPPLPFRVLGPVLKPFLKKQILHKAMTPGFKLPARLKPEFGPADAPALEDARKCIAIRLHGQTTSQPFRTTRSSVR